MRLQFFIPILLLSLSACTIPGFRDESFLSLYKANVEANVSQIEEFSELIGINRHESIEGVVSSVINIPGILSGWLSSNYNTLIDGRNSESFFHNLDLKFTSLLSSGALSIGELALVSHGADSFISYKNVSDIGLIPTEMQTIIKKYENNWLNMSKGAESEMSAEELMGYNIARNLIGKSLSDVSNYATEYPIWKDTADLGMSGALHMWSIDMNRTNMVELAKKLSLDLAGTGMTAETISNLEKSLNTITFTGSLWFDPKNPEVSYLDGTISLSGTIIGWITISKNLDSTNIKLTSPEDQSALVLNFAKKETKYTLDASVLASGIEAGKISSYVEFQDRKLREISLEASVEGMTMTMKHTITGDTFVWKLSAVVGTLDWSWTIKDDRVTTLKINGTSPFATLSADLSSTGSDMMRGLVTIKQEWSLLAQANLGLEIAKEKFGFIVDVLNEELPVHAEMMITAKTNSSSKKVSAPESKYSFEEFMTELEALTGPTYSDSDSSIDDMDLSSTGTNSDTISQ